MGPSELDSVICDASTESIFESSDVTSKAEVSPDDSLIKEFQALLQRHQLNDGQRVALFPSLFSCLLDDFEDEESRFQFIQSVNARLNQYKDDVSGQTPKKSNKGGLMK